MSKSKIQNTKKKQKKHIAVGIAHLNATFNNIIVTITDLNGNVVAWASAGGLGFKGSRKSTPYAAQMTAAKAVENAKTHGLKTLQEVRVKGPGAGRESAIRALQSDVNIISLRDITPIPHNGCRPKKRRRV